MTAVPLRYIPQMGDNSRGSGVPGCPAAWRWATLGVGTSPEAVRHSGILEEGSRGEAAGRARLQRR